MKLRSWPFLLVGRAGMVLGAVLPLLAQPVPDVVWQTNAHRYGVMSLAFSADSALLASGGNEGTVKLWRVADAALLRTFNTPQASVLAVAISPGGQYLAAGTDDDEACRGVYLWRMEDGARLWRGGCAAFYGIAFSPDGVWLAHASSAGGVGLTRVDGSAGLVLYEHSDEAWAVAFSGDGVWIASGGVDRSAKVWSVRGGFLAHDFMQHPSVVQSVMFRQPAPTDALATASSGTRLWRLEDGALVRILDSGETAIVAFSPDGRLLATVECPFKFFRLNGGPIRFWRVADGCLLVSYPDADALALALSPNGEWLAYGRGNGMLVLARMPLWISEASRIGNEVTLQWQGGSGRYQVQARTNLAVGQWENLGPATTNRIATVACSNLMFFRVQSLPVP